MSDKMPGVPPPPIAENLQMYLEMSPFISMCGIRAVSVDAKRGEVVLDLPFKPDLARLENTAQFHGGVLMALADTAGMFALAIMSNAPAPTINMRVDYLRPAKGDVRAKAIVRRNGRSVGTVDVDITDGSSEVVAVGRGTFATGG